MKAIFIPTGGYPDLNEINKELKNCTAIVKEISSENGSILIIDNVTRKDKLEQIRKNINDDEEGTDNTSN